MEQKRNVYLDWLRIFACIMVVGVHVSALCLESVEVTSLNFKVMNGFDCFSILGVPLFVMISGSLLLSETYADDMKTLYRKKMLRLVGLYFFWFLFYNVVNFVESGMAWNFANIKQEILLESLLSRGIYHLWFLPMMISLYLITPFIKPFMADKKKCIVFVALFFVLAILIPTFLKFEFPYKRIVQSLYEHFPNVMFLGYIGYYILGHVLHEFLPVLKKKTLLCVAAAGVLVFGIEVYMCNLHSEQIGEASIILNDTMAANAFLACGAIFVLVKHIPWKENKVVAKVSKVTFGVYLLHPFVLHMLNNAGLDTLFAPAYVTVPMVTVLVTLLTALLVLLLSKIPGVRRLL